MRSVRTWFALGIAALLLLVLVVTGLLTTRGLDLTAYRQQITAQVQGLTGRTFAIGEDLKLRLRSGLVIEARGLKVGNANWGSRTTMLAVPKTELRLALYPLLQGKLHIEHIALEGPDLVLETDKSGKGNWEFDSGGTGGHSGLNVASISIESGSVEWRGANSSASEPVKFSDISIQAKDDGSTLTLSAVARIFGEMLRFQGYVASPRTWDRYHPIDLDFHVVTAAGDLQVEGTLENTPLGVTPRVSLFAEQLDLSVLADIVGHDAQQLPTVSVAMDLAKEGGAWNVALKKAAFGKSDLAGSIRFDGTPDEPRISGALTANRFELGELLASPAAEPSADDSGQRVFSARPIDLVFLSSLNADLKLQAARLGTPRQDFRDANLHAKVLDNQLTLWSQGHALEGKGKLQSKLFIDANKELPSWSLNLKLIQYPASALQRAAAVTALNAPVDLSLDVNARGLSPQQMAQSLSGKARIIVGKGRAQMKTVDNLVGGLSTVAGQIFEAGTNDTQLNCVIGDVIAKHGVVTTQVALIDSAASTLRVDGKVDLGNEKIDLTVTPKPKKPTLTVAVPVHVRGDLHDPEFEPDRTSSLAKLIGVGSLLIYPPAAVVALGDLGDSGNACTEMINSPSAPVKKERSPVRRVAESIGDAASTIGLGIKRLFGD